MQGLEQICNMSQIVFKKYNTLVNKILLILLFSTINQFSLCSQGLNISDLHELALQSSDEEFNSIALDLGFNYIVGGKLNNAPSLEEAEFSGELLYKDVRNEHVSNKIKVIYDNVGPKNYLDLHKNFKTNYNYEFVKREKSAYYFSSGSVSEYIPKINFELEIFENSDGTVRIEYTIPERIAVFYKLNKYLTNFYDKEGFDLEGFDIGKGVNSKNLNMKPNKTYVIVTTSQNKIDNPVISIQFNNGKKKSYDVSDKSATYVNEKYTKYYFYEREFLVDSPLTVAGIFLATKSNESSNPYIAGSIFVFSKNNN